MNNSNVLEATSIEEVVAIINTSDDPNEVALEYATDAALEAGYGDGEDEINAHLDVLEQHGAIFERMLPVEYLWILDKPTRPQTER